MIRQIIRPSEYGMIGPGGPVEAPVPSDTDDASYPDGACYVLKGGNPEDWSAWHSSEGWDLFFKVIIKTGP